MATQFLISTTGADVTISDLGLVLFDPVVDRDLALEFGAEEIAASEDLTSAIQNSDVIVKIQTDEYGVYQVDPDEYLSFSFLEQSLPSFEKEEFVTEPELDAKYLDSFIQEGVFPFNLSSTTAVTNVVTSVNATFQDWRVAPNDIIGIFGTTVSDGYFTVESVTNQTTLVTVESLSTSSGVGTLAIYHPPGATKVGVNDTNFTTISGTVLQNVLESIDSSMVQNLDDLLDVDVSTNPPLDGYVLAYNSGLAEWQASELGGGAGGQANTASNVGVGGVGPFKQKVGVNLEFKNINTRSSLLEVIDDVANNEIDLNVFNNDDSWNANQLRGVPISGDSPIDGYALEYDGYQWVPVSVTNLIELEHRNLDQLVHDIAENSYTEYTYSGNKVTNITVYTNNTKSKKIREEEFTYNGTKLDTAVTIQYDGAGVIAERLTETFVYFGVKVSYVDSVLEEF